MTNVRPLVMRCGAFGDMVLLTTLRRRLHARLGQPVDIISSGSWTLPLLEGQPAVGEIFIIDTRKVFLCLTPRQLSLTRWLRARAAGPTWFCDPGAGRELLRRGGIPDSHVCDVNALPPIPGEHYVERWHRFADTTPPAFAGALPPSPASVAGDAVVEITPAARAGRDAWLARAGLAGRPLILVQAGNKRTTRGWRRRRTTNTKYWPEERWAAVVRALREERPDHAILLVGVPAEYSLNEEIARLAAVSDVQNIADDRPIPEFLALLECAHSMVSVDTGPAHAAAALGCPTVVLFGSAGKPELYRPGGTRTPAAILTGVVNGEPSMLGIEVATVMDAWRKLVGRFSVTISSPTA